MKDCAKSVGCRLWLFFIFLVVLMASWVFTGQPAFSQAGISISPTFVEFNLAPGGRQSFTVSLSNQSDREKTYRLQPVDVYQNPRTGQYLPVREDGDDSQVSGTQFSCADWLSTQEEIIVVGPQQSKRVEVSLQVPRNTLPGGYAALVFFEEVLPDDPQRPGQARIRVKISGGTVVFLEVRSRGVATTRSGKFGVLERMEAVTSPFDEVVVLATLANLGTRFIEVAGRGRLVLFRDGQRVSEIPVIGGQGRVLPGQKLTFPFIIPSPYIPGNYRVEVLMDYGGNSTARAELTFGMNSSGLIEGAVAETSSAVAEDPIRLALNRDLLKTGIAPRAARALTFILYNDSPDPVSVEALVRDIAEVESTRFSQYAEVVPPRFIVQPYDRQNVQVRVRCPASFPDGNKYLEALFVPTLVGQKPLTQEIQEAFSVPAFIILENRLGETLESMTLEGLEIALEEWEDGLYPRFSARFKNTGNVHLQPRLEMVLVEAEEREPDEGIGIIRGEDDQGRIDMRADPYEDLVLPGQEGVLSAVSMRPLHPTVREYRLEVVLWEENRELFRDELEIRL